jgi:hypothetical protein
VLLLLMLLVGLLMLGQQNLLQHWGLMGLVIEGPLWSRR